MKKLFTILVIPLLIFAQSDDFEEQVNQYKIPERKVGIGIEAFYNLPVGDLKSSSSYGLGGNVYISYYKFSLSHLIFDESYFFTNLFGGYDKFFEKNGNGYSLQTIPVGLSFSIPFEVEDIFVGFVVNLAYSFNTQTMKHPYIQETITNYSQKFHYSFGPYFIIPYAGNINIRYSSFGNGYKYWSFGFRKFLRDL